MKKNCNKYFIHLDGDEYINLNNNFKNINQLLKHYNYPKILILNWLLFGSNNKESNDNKYKCLIPTYTKCDNKLCDHFKILININELKKMVTFINPHQIFNVNDSLKYTNINNKNFNFNEKKNYYDLFKKSVPNISLQSAKAYINHYVIQSKEDYENRKINRNRDDIPQKEQLINLFIKIIIQHQIII